jgi:hypothetical protein
MDEAWKRRVLELRRRTTEAEDLEYVKLVYQAMDACTLDVVETLLQTFTDDPDYGVQESVVSVLASADPIDYMVGLARYYIRLVAEAPEWAEVLLERAVEQYPLELAQAARQVNSETRSQIVSAISDDQFIKHHPNALEVAAQINYAGLKSRN